MDAPVNARKLLKLLNPDEFNGLLATNSGAVEEENRRLFYVVTAVAAAIFGALIPVGIFLAWGEFVKIYMVFGAVTAAALVYSRAAAVRGSEGTSVLAAEYSYLAALFVMSLWIAFFITPRGSMVLSAFCFIVIPLLLIDSPRRLLLFAASLAAIFTALSFSLLPPTEAQVYTINCLYSSVAGLVMGLYISEMRLKSIDARRLLAAQSLEIGRGRLLYESAVKAANIVVWEYDIPGRRLIMPNGSNADVAKAHYGFEDNAIENVPEVFYCHCCTEKDLRDFRKMFAEIQAGKPVVSGEFWFKNTPSSPPRRERITYSVVCDDQGRPLRAYGLGQDITAMAIDEDRYKKRLKDLLIADPTMLCLLRLNLTKNYCGKLRGTSQQLVSALKSDTVDELFARTAALITSEEDRRKFLALFDRNGLAEAYRNGARQATLEYSYVNEQHFRIWVSNYISLDQNPQTRDIEAVLYYKDVDERKRCDMIVQHVTDEEFDYLALLHTPSLKFYFCYVGRMFTDAYGVIVSNLRRPLDYSVVLRHALKSWVHPDEYERFLQETDICTYKNMLAQSASHSIQLKAVRDGAERWKLLKYSYLDDTDEWILLTQSDVTEIYHKNQQKQQALAEQLQREQELRREATAANEMKTSFLSNVSHDMRTPLNAVLGYADMALKTDDAGASRGCVEKIKQAGDTLMLLINDTLDLQKIENGKTTLTPTPVALTDLIASVVTAVRPMMDEKELSFESDLRCKPGLCVSADDMRMQKIFINLLSNAAKYTPRGGRVRFAAVQTAQSGASVSLAFTVEDSGIGISEDFLSKIYEPFAQERTAETAHIGGSGLGLSIVKRLVELMGGEISVESELGGGSRFTVALTLPLAAKTAAAQPQASHAQLSGKKILLCEDNEMNTEIAVNLLKSGGLQVLCASNGRRGVESFAASEPEEFAAILMDIRMPVMDGCQAASAIRALPRPDAQTVPIIAMSADAYESDVERSLAAGMNSHIAKPISAETVFAELAKYIGN